MIPENEARLRGKLSRVGPLRYTPSGLAVREALLAVSQTVLGKRSVGYHDLLLQGEIAERQAEGLRIGSVIQVTGVVWSRRFKNTKGTLVSETKIVVESLERPETRK